MHRLYLRGYGSASISTLISQKSKIFDSFSQEKPLRPVGAVAPQGRQIPISNRTINENLHFHTNRARFYNAPCIYSRLPMVSPSSWAISRSEMMELDIRKPSGVSR